MCVIVCGGDAWEGVSRRDSQRGRAAACRASTTTLTYVVVVLSSSGIHGPWVAVRVDELADIAGSTHVESRNERVHSSESVAGRGPLSTCTKTGLARALVKMT